MTMIESMRQGGLLSTSPNSAWEFLEYVVKKIM